MTGGEQVKRVCVCGNRRDLAGSPDLSHLHRQRIRDPVSETRPRLHWRVLTTTTARLMSRLHCQASSTHYEAEAVHCRGM